MPPDTAADRARARIDAHADLNAFVTVSSEQGPGPLVAVKDLIDVRGLPTTGGGPGGGVPATRDAAAIARLRPSGAVVVGKTNLYEWGFGVGSDNLHHGPVRNPRDRLRSAGGSSGGSAAAVAAGLCDWAVGTDTAGSVRIPAALCGVVGFKPSHGVVPLDGTIPLSPSQDTIGVLAPDVDSAWEAATLLGVPAMPRLAGVGVCEAPRSFDELRLAVPRDWGEDDLDDETAAAWRRAADALPRIPFPNRARLFELAADVQAHEAHAVHGAALRATPERFRPAVRERIARGATIDDAACARARRELVDLATAVERAMTGLDAIVLPTTACVAPLLSEPEAREPLTRFTRPFNATGQPAFSIPLPTDGLPVGLQVVGRCLCDGALADVARTVAARLGAPAGGPTAGAASA